MTEMKDLFIETLKRDKEFREAMEKAHIAYINEHWGELDEMNKTTFRILYEDRVPK